MIEIQTSMSERAIELLCLLPASQGGAKYLLDIGCGSGLSGSVLEENGHFWVGLDISKCMLDVAKDREVEGDVILADMGQGIFFRPGTFDGVVSISALQWIMNADKSSHDPRKRTIKFFQSLYGCMTRGARAVFQFYPENASQMELITSCAMRCGFGGGLVVDYPHSTRAKKYFLCLFSGTPNNFQLPKPLGEDNSNENVDSDEEKKKTIKFTNERRKQSYERSKRETREPVKSKNWILSKKEAQRKKGKEVRPDTKYTGRKRSGPRF